MAKRKRIARKLTGKVRLNWHTVEQDKHGNRIWKTVNGRYILRCSEFYDGIKLPKEYSVWEEYFSQAVGALDYRKVYETTGLKRAIKECETRQFKYDQESEAA